MLKTIVRSVCKHSIYRLIVNNCKMSSIKKTISSLPSVLPANERLIWIDCEMTGLDLNTDTLLEIAVVVTEGDTLETIAKTESIIIHAEDSVLDNMNDWCIKQHGVSGLTQACKDSKISCAEAEKMVLDMLARHTEKGKCPLAGNSVGQDRRLVKIHGLDSKLRFKWSH